VAVARALLDHPSADVAAAMLMHKENVGWTALMRAAIFGYVDVARVLLDHPSADAEAMLMHAEIDGETVLEAAARRGLASPLLFLLRRYDEVSPSAGDGGIDTATAVLTAMCNGHRRTELFEDTGPGAAVRDECITRLLARGASVVVPATCQPVVSRIIRESVLMASVPRLINDAVVGLATSRQQQQKRRR
jgi:hypothetical protein